MPSVRELKQRLDALGVSYVGVVEKDELLKLEQLAAAAACAKRSVPAEECHKRHKHHASSEFARVTIAAAVLGVPPDAPSEKVHAAHKMLVRAHHPDKNPGDAAAESRFKEVQAAFELLSSVSHSKRASMALAAERKHARAQARRHEAEAAKAEAAQHQAQQRRQAIAKGALDTLSPAKAPLESDEERWAREKAEWLRQCRRSSEQEKARRRQYALEQQKADGRYTEPDPRVQKELWLRAKRQEWEQMVQQRRKLAREERGLYEQKLLDNPRLLASLVDAMVETGTMPPVVSTEEFKSDKFFLVDLVVAHLSILKNASSSFVPKPYMVNVEVEPAFGVPSAAIQLSDVTLGEFEA